MVQRYINYHWLICLFLSFLILSTTITAQNAHATITGLVSNVNGDVIPKAKVIATMVNSNTSRYAFTNKKGRYVVPFLTPGVYRISIEVNGERLVVHESFTVHVGDSREFNIKLEDDEKSDKKG
jgi:hypothetical protein